ncbi:DNA-binding transcriptional MocR family regulator [Herbihabitans rhizosphaerae]|uniref:DNA-binding transcriptional MocR family regulator n=1 Tax=Herbihabitans rhizosphaerae TaxID=1872711 RepID=A0A4Q7KXX7_9PSEU|nr:PLP-dependent aminotransferase family protein [Herbihabitans rhizosphaerae]RZS40861.1 DNA-binding transcriptional MocR family regulator [Herbihabitans rhizosphaerae]
MASDSSGQRLAALLRTTVAAGRTGDRLPSSRELVAEYRVSPVTVRSAIAQLEREGLVVVKSGAGTFVAPPPRPRHPVDTDWQLVAMGDEPSHLTGFDQVVAGPPPGTIPLASGFLAEDLQATAEIGAALRRAMARPEAWSWVPEGLAPLRDWFAAEIDPRLTAGDVLISSGTQTALSTVFRSICPDGAPVLIESPAYIGATAAARAARLPVIAIPTDRHGIRTDLLAAPLASTGARVIYVQPAHANPHGATLSDERRAELLALARRHGAFVIEDDWARYLSFAATPSPPLITDDEDGHVLHLSSLSKPAAPGLRVGAIVARGPVARRLRRARVVDDFFVTPLLQETALQLVTSPSWPRHLRRLHAELHRRRDHLVALVRDLLGPDVLPYEPTGGMHLWLRLPDGADATEVAEAAARQGVMVNPGRPWFPSEPTGEHLRISFGGAPVEAMTAGVRVLAAALR